MQQPVCKIHRLAPLTPTRDPVATDGEIVPYGPPPDVLTTELSDGAPRDGAPTGHEGHDKGGMDGMKMEGMSHDASDEKAPEGGGQR